MVTSLVDNLRPAGRDQVKLRDRVLRATIYGLQQTAQGNSTVLQWDMGAYASFTIVISGDSSQFTIDGSADLVTWAPLDYQVLNQSAPTSPNTGVYVENVAAVGGIPTTVFAGNKQTRFVRVRLVNASSSRICAVVATLSQTPFQPTKQARHLSSDQGWSYVAPVGGISTTAAVTLKAAVNTFHRNLVTQLQIANGGTAGTEVAITDSISSTVLWRHYLPPGSHLHVPFDPPLRASANAALTLAISASSGAAVYPSVQGLVALA